MTTVGFGCALAEEARHFERGSTGPGQGPDGSRFLVSGIGPAAARRGAEALIGAGAGALVSFGLAGGLDPALAPGTVCLPGEVVGGPGPGLPTDAGWRSRLQARLAGRAPVAGGVLLASEDLVATPAAKARLFAATGAVAVDLESRAIGEVAAERGLPFLVVRVIVDGAGDGLPPVVALATEGGTVRLGRLLGALARRPADLAPLVRLARRYAVAGRALALLARPGFIAGCVCAPEAAAGRAA